MRVCLVTTGQPSTNPRLVKEADALTGAGHTVEAIGAHWSAWASALDPELLRTRSWQFRYVGGDRRQPDLSYQWTRVRHKLARSLWPRVGNLDLAIRAYARPAAELAAAARRTPADLYIAHTVGALPAAVAAARQHGARVGFDAEDFYSGMQSMPGSEPDPQDQLAEVIERAWLPHVDFMVAGSPAMADAYAALYGIRRPVPIYNVFPLSYRPAHPPAPRNAQDPLRLYWFSQTIGPNRGLEDAIRAMGLLSAYPIELHLRGEWQAGYEAQLRTLAAEAGLPEGRLFSYAPAPPDRMAILASEFDAGLALEVPVSRNDDVKIPNKICMYLLAGIAVIATATTGQVGLMNEIPDAGILCPPNDPQALAAGLERWCRDRRALDRARSRAWHYGATRFHWEIEQQRLLDVVEGRLS